MTWSECFVDQFIANLQLRTWPAADHQTSHRSCEVVRRWDECEVARWWGCDDDRGPRASRVPSTPFSFAACLFVVVVAVATPRDDDSELPNSRRTS